jgi:hypothetical protein
MSGGKIYIIREDETLQALSEQEYASENLLQVLLAKYPDLLAGDQIDQSSPRRWVLVSREFGIAGEDEGEDRWYLDHLFLDQDGIPTLVEVKRSADTRARREVVAQMLDYAANAVLYGSIEDIRHKFEETCKDQSVDPIDAITNLLEPKEDENLAIEDFWERVKTNLQAGKIRMIFVADKISPELKRIVEFLNEQMNRAEVIAIEIAQYAGDGIKTLVPRVFGQTAESEAKATKTRDVEKRWDAEKFFAELAKHGKTESEVARQIMEWVKAKSIRIWWGFGSRAGSLVPTVDHKRRKHQLFAIWSIGTLEIYFYWYAYKPPFDTEEKRLEILKRLNRIKGISLSEDEINKRPNIPLSAFNDPQALQQFLEIYDWIVNEIKAL